MKNDDDERRELIISVVLLVVLALVAYGNSFSGPFVFDDLGSVVRKDFYDPTFTNIRRAVFRQRAVVDLSFIANRAVNGLEVRGYHVVNLGVHLAAALALLGVLRRTPGCRPLALPVSLIFLVHPLQTESVSYISQRAQALMGFFELLSFYCVARAQTATRRAAWHAGAVVAFALALLSKPQVVLMPPLVVLYARAFFAASVKEVLRRSRGLYVALFSSWLLGALYLAYGLRRAGWADIGAGGQTPWSYLAAQLVAIPLYLWRSIFPATLVFDYGWKGVAWWQSALGAVAVAGLVAATVFAWRRSPPLGFLGAWFFLNIAPGSSVIPRVDLVVEHRMYVPLIAVIAGVAALGRFLPKNARLPLLGLVAVVLIARTRARNEDYSSPLALWRATIVHAPGNARAHHNLATLYKEKDDLQTAILEYTRAVECDPALAEAWIDRGDVKSKLGRHEEAIADYSKAVDNPKRGPVALYDRGNSHRALGHRAEAIADFTRAIEMRKGTKTPTFVDAVFNRGCAYQEGGENEKAIADYTETIALKPDYVGAFLNRGHAYFAAGRENEAFADFEKAIGLAPTRGDAYFGRALVLAQKGRHDAAWQDVRRARALKFTPPADALEWLRKLTGRAE